MASTDRIPLAEICRRKLQPELLRYDLIETLLVHHGWNLIQVIGVIGRDDGLFLHIGEQRDLLALLLGERLLGPAHENVRLDADGP